MSTNISRLVYALRQASAGTGRPLRPGPAEQIVAAALGYGSLAAYQAAIAAGTERPLLDLVDHLVIDAVLATERALEVGEPIGRLLELLAQVAAQLLPRTKVHPSASAFEGHINDLLMYDAANGSETSGPMAETNGDGIDEIYIPFELEFTADVGEEEFVEIEGHVAMGIHPERPYAGHRIDVTASVSFTRVGRSLVNDVRAGVDQAALDYDW